MVERLAVVNASFGYSAKPVFSDVNLSINSGEVFSLLGPNGCGKTTLLRCLNGLLKLQRGNVYLNGADIAELDTVKVAQTVAYVFQGQGVAFPYSVREMVRMGRTPHLGFFASPSQRDAEIAENALFTVGILHLADASYGQISGGERQLVLIARALAQEPSVMLLDEPTSHLDFGNQTLVLQTIAQLAAQKKIAVVMTTHFPNHALHVSGNVALMKKGGFLASGRPEEVMTEENLAELYGIRIRVVQTNVNETGQSRLIVPVMSLGVERVSSARVP